jgi:uncharacterized protein
MKRSSQVLGILFLMSGALFVSCTKKSDTSATAQSGQGSAGTSSQKNINIGTASIGGAYYAVGQEIANLVNKYTAGLSMAPEVTAGSVENPRLVDHGDADFGITNANLAYAAVRGEAPYNKILNIKALGNLHPSIFHIITLESSSIKTLANLKGKKVAVGPAGGGTLPILEIILKEYGLSLSDITPSYIAYNDGFTQLSDGNVDVALALSGYPASSVLELSTTKKIRFLQVTEKDMQNIVAQYPYYTTIMVPKDVYRTDTDARALAINNVLFVNGSMDENTVYKVTKAVYGHLAEFAHDNATAKQIDAAHLTDTAIELHAGAKKYFAENK